MAWRFRRSMQVLPGIRMTQTQNGIGWSFGTRSLRVNRSPKGAWSRSVSIPGTGLSNVTRIPSPLPGPPATRPTQPARPQPQPQHSAWTGNVVRQAIPVTPPGQP
jgi:hypothetical protein